MNFSRDWTSEHANNWKEWLGHLIGKPCVSAIEVGTFEFRSSLWFLENILTSSVSFLVGIDSLPHVENKKKMQDFFCGRFYFYESNSFDALRKMFSRRFDFAYVCGSNRLDEILEDMILSFRLLKADGVLIADCYSRDDRHKPMDAFLDSYQGQYEAISKGDQLAIRKNKW